MNTIIESEESISLHQNALNFTSDRTIATMFEVVVSTYEALVTILINKILKRKYIFA